MQKEEEEGKRICGGLLHARGVGLDADGVLVGTGAEQDLIGHFFCLLKM